MSVLLSVKIAETMTRYHQVTKQTTQLYTKCKSDINKPLYTGYSKLC